MLRARFADREVLFPTKWEEVSLRQFLAIDTNPSLIVALASDPDLLRGFPDAGTDAGVRPYLEFVRILPDFETMALPDHFTMTVSDEAAQQRTIRRPTDIGLETYGQKLTIDEELRRLRAAGTYELAQIALPLLSVYLYPQLSSKPFLDIADTKPYESAVLNLPCTIALPLAGFFLRSLSSLTPSGKVSYELIPDPTRSNPWWKRPGRWFRGWRFSSPTSRRTPSPSTAA